MPRDAEMTERLLEAKHAPARADPDPQVLPQAALQTGG
jgi:hypothetical protein